jgi:hypothetical protein
LFKVIARIAKLSIFSILTGTALITSAALLFVVSYSYQVSFVNDRRLSEPAIDIQIEPIQPLGPQQIKFRASNRARHPIEIIHVQVEQPYGAAIAPGFDNQSPTGVIVRGGAESGADLEDAYVPPGSSIGWSSLIVLPKLAVPEPTALVELQFTYRVLDKSGQIGQVTVSNRY